MSWMQFYYAHPAPERFAEEVRALANTGALDPPPTRVVIGTFLGMVMRANPDRIHGWTTELADLRGAARDTLHIAAALSATREGRAFLVADRADPRLLGPPPDTLERAIDDPTVLDILWAYYFATGDARAVRRIISALDHLGDLGAAARFKTTAQTDQDRARALNDALYQAASWSLVSLMQQHAPLVTACEQIFDRGGLAPNERVGLALTLQKVAPDRWKVHVDTTSGLANITGPPR